MGVLAVTALLAAGAFLMPWIIDNTISAASKAGPAPARVDIPRPHSGEDRLQKGGSIVRVADPRQKKPEALEEGWQLALWGSVNQALAAGEEQVVLVFSRQGCPWC